ncbi:hypothetical protein ACJX0J_024930, partial [Zea mays]
KFETERYCNPFTRIALGMQLFACVISLSLKDAIEALLLLAIAYPIAVVTERYCNPFTRIALGMQ